MPGIVENAILVYTDGSLYPKGRKGGYGIVFIHVDAVGDEHIIEECSPPGIGGTTNNRMELQACIDALKRVPELSPFSHVARVVIRTDSRYVVDHYRRALGEWARNRWRSREGRPIDNAVLWKELAKAYRKLRKPVDINWVKGHAKGLSKDQYNVAADKLAKASAKNPLSRPVFRSSVRRKKSSKSTRRGSVRVFGQTTIIYVIEVEWMPVQRIWKYRYQVVSRDSPDCDNLDWIYSKHQMRDGHYYRVQVNDRMAAPEVVEVVEEVQKDTTE